MTQIETNDLRLWLLATETTLVADKRQTDKHECHFSSFVAVYRRRRVLFLNLRIIKTFVVILKIVPQLDCPRRSFFKYFEWYRLARWDHATALLLFCYITTNDETEVGRINRDRNSKSLLSAYVFSHRFIIFSKVHILFWSNHKFKVDNIPSKSVFWRRCLLVTSIFPGTARVPAAPWG